MVARVPVIATSIGGLPEVVTDGEAGRLLPVGDVSGMARAALKLIRDPGSRKAMGRAGRERAKRHFRRELVVPRYEALYRRLAAEPRDRSSVPMAGSPS